MGVRIFIGHEQGDSGPFSEQACLFDSVTGYVFGPLFRESEDGAESAEDCAQAFLDYIAEHDGRDARQLSPAYLDDLYAAWLKQHEPAELT